MSVLLVFYARAPVCVCALRFYLIKYALSFKLCRFSQVWHRIFYWAFFSGLGLYSQKGGSKKDAMQVLGVHFPAETERVCRGTEINVQITLIDDQQKHLIDSVPSINQVNNPSVGTSIIMVTSKRENTKYQYANIGVAKTTESKKNYAESTKIVLTSDFRCSKLKVQAKDSRAE